MENEANEAYIDPLDLQNRMAGKVRSRGGRPLASSKYRFIRAMKNTRGIKSLIAGNLGVVSITVDRLLDRPDWQDVRELWLAEKERCADIAEDRVIKAIEQWREVETSKGDKVMVGDADLSFNASKWLLSKMRPKEFGDKTTTVLEGGENPIKMMQGMVDLSQLALPPEIMRQVLNALDAKDEAEREAAAIQPQQGQLPAPAFPPAPMMGGFVAQVPAKAKVGVKKGKQ